jgi:hypothetical protein
MGRLVALPLNMTLYKGCKSWAGVRKFHFYRGSFQLQTSHAQVHIIRSTHLSTRRIICKARMTKGTNNQAVHKITSQFRNFQIAICSGWHHMHAAWIWRSIEWCCGGMTACRTGNTWAVEACIDASTKKAIDGDGGLAWDDVWRLWDCVRGRWNPRAYRGTLGHKRFVLAAKTGFCWRARHPTATLSQ